MITTLESATTREVDDPTHVRSVLANLGPSHPDYPTLPLSGGFNWAECLTALDSFHWYIVVFRSVRRESADTELLIWHDDRAHQEAAAAPGFLHYFKGQLNERRECLSFCIWSDQAAARQAAGRHDHHAAAALAAEMFESYRLERYLLDKDGPDEPLTIRHISR